MSQPWKQIPHDCDARKLSEREGHTDEAGVQRRQTFA